MRAQRDEVQTMSEWCFVHSLALNTTKTKEMILDFKRKQDTDLGPLHIKVLEKVETFQFQGILLSVDLSQSNDTATIKKAQQRQHFFSVLRRYGMERKLRASSMICKLLNYRQ